LNNTQLHIQDQRLSLKRFPANQFDKSLRAWDAADEYIINHVCDELDTQSINNICIINDGFGALSCALSRLIPHANIHVFTDSIMSKHAIEQNLKGSNLDKNHVSIASSVNVYEDMCAISSSNSSSNDLSTSTVSTDSVSNNTTVDLILIKIPRTLAYLDFILAQVNLTLHSQQSDKQAVIIGAAMVKLVTSSALKVFDKQLDNTKTSLAKKKARLIFAEPSGKKAEHQQKQSERFVKQVSDEAISFTLHNFPNVFCREQVDIGARYLLDNLPDIDLPKNSKQDQVIIDLGCGNGILGTSLLQEADACNKTIKLIFVDESYMAIESARMTLANSQVSEANKANAEFIVSHCLSDYLAQSDGNNGADVVICNPPFHQQNTVIDDIAWQMFSDAKTVLKQGGELRIVGNRHLEHRLKLVKLFGGCKVVASDKKFVVLSSIK
jgi:16S rRNA (guanine1207-N2)-methyltransferase/23S rRNA (guanine1835-N2)-methyltransferase